MSGNGAMYGGEFRDIQHGNSFFNPVDIDLHLVDPSDGERLAFQAQLVQIGDLADDTPPVIYRCVADGQKIDVDEVPFSGLLPDLPKFAIWRFLSFTLLENSCHIPPVRQAIARSYDLSTARRSALRPFSNDAVAHMMLNDIELKNHVGSWMSENLGGWKIDTKQNLDTFQLVAKRSGREVNLADAGQGIQQILPIVALCCKRHIDGKSQNSLDIVEQPELHLHDAAHAALGDLLIHAVSNGGGNIVVETHSEALVLRIRRRIAEGSLSPDSVAIYYVNDAEDGSELHRINVNEIGEVDWWPEGVFSESFVEVKAIRHAQRARA
jgi:hypothetical protein